MARQRPLRIGLTGGIGSGKSTVSQQFQALGVPVIDTDQIARELVQPGQATLHAIQTQFGDHILKADGQLNRKALRQLIFQDPDQRLALEQILHPAIRKAAIEAIKTIEAQSQQRAINYLVLVVPLLIENHYQKLVDRILVIDCSEQTQLQRVQQRDHTDPQQTQAIINSQIPRQQRLAQADDIINNEPNDPQALKRAVLALHQSYLKA